MIKTVYDSLFIILKVEVNALTEKKSRQSKSPYIKLSDNKLGINGTNAELLNQGSNNTLQG